MTFEKRIKAIPGEDGFWKRAAEKEFVRRGLRLEHLGVHEDEVVDILTRLYWATASCYGE